MDIDDDSTIVDLSVSRRSNSPQKGRGSSKRSPSPTMNRHNTSSSNKRCLRPRTEVKSYVEVPDIVVISDVDEIRQNGYTNGYAYSDSEDDGAELPPLPEIKELSLEERELAEKKIKELKEELRNEEMKLVLLKKLRQSQQLKENVAERAMPGATNPALMTQSLSAHSNRLPSGTGTSSHRTGGSKSGDVPPIPPLRGLMPNHSQASPTVLSSIGNSHSSGRSIAPGMPSNMFPVPSNRSMANSSINLSNNSGISISSVSTTSNGRNSSPSSTNNNMSYQNNAQDRLKEISITPTAGPFNISQLPLNSDAANNSKWQEQDRSRNEDNQTPAQRQAAAKLALRKQLEKTLLQIPPPKPPPPEMHFIPNPSNTEFVYLLGLEYVVDYITKDQKTPIPPDPFCCSQCNTSFTPVWKWEKSTTKVKDGKVICESCVTSNVKKALKAEHTNRLKTAFVKALQQEQEIEQRLAQNMAMTVESPPPTPTPLPTNPTVAQLISAAAAASNNNTPKPPIIPPTAKAVSRHATTPTPTRETSLPVPKMSVEAAVAAAAKFSPQAAAAAAMQQQMMRGLPTTHQPLPAHMLQFPSLLYPYQLAMAQAASGKNPVASFAELQRQAVDLQRQYLMDMMPSAAGASGSSNASRQHAHALNNWKS